jgi:hypothetical protein
MSPSMDGEKRHHMSGPESAVAHEHEPSSVAFAESPATDAMPLQVETVSGGADEQASLTPCAAAGSANASSAAARVKNGCRLPR